MKQFGFSGAYFEITNQCNLNCATCYNRSGLNKQTIESSIEQITTAVRTLVSHGANIISFAGGEPLLHSQLDAILKLTQDYPKTWFTFVTNGTIHKQNFIDFYNTCGNVNVQISLDGSCDEINRLTRGNGNFNRTKAFIQKLIPNHRTIITRMVVSRYNYHDVEKFYRETLSWGCMPDFAFVNRIGNAQSGWEEMSVTPQQKLQVLKLIMSLNEEHQLKVNLPFSTNHCPLAEDYDGMLNLIKPDGTILPCQLIYDEKFTLGNIFEFDPEQFIKRCDDISKLVLKRFDLDYNCHRCVVRNHCKHGCMAYAIDFCGDPLAYDGECEYRRLQFLAHDMQNVRFQKV